MNGPGAGASGRVDGPVLGRRGTAWNPETRLYADGVVTGADGAPLVVPPHGALRRLPDTPFLDPASGTLPGAARPGPAEVARAAAETAAATLPGAGTRYAAMARTAFVDIRALLYPNGALVAAASPYWHYVWPRDAGFCAVALCLGGRHGDALRALRYVCGLQEPDGTWQARYLPDGSGRVPDRRGTQLDGIGWTLWALWVWAATAPARTVAAELADMLATVRAAADAMSAAVDPGTGLPRPSQDYWERDVDEATLGTAAPLLLGARAAADLLGRAGDGAAAARCARVRDLLRDGIRRHFAPLDFPRRVGGGGRDASVAFLLPPFSPMEPGPHAAWRRTLAALRLANGGVGGGEEWADTRTAWTPQVSLFAMTAAATGERHLAEGLLTWLEERRTRLGALPEKVTEDGRPAAVAPLALTGASVLIALASLEGRPPPTPPG
ncbi:hypothetical protein SAMN02745673_00833 [Marinactinospora thermotolerans DSM 45154]|uniref:GH15-like domain-containing protein n=1 Tax=Marinactinospora thermotolerans DSM 45154 TaxID=1122192 RepID=A0A1T4LV64_9ACTN|nr:hypothetical protein SAMN02745673_00833 [Marinactinospora thermotolerans DSM 45154]